MRCLKHRKSVVGTCQWCGAQLCIHCISKKEGKKLYCEKCTIRLTGVRRFKLPTAAPARLPEKQDLLKDRRQQQTQNKYVIDKDGYLIIEQ